MKYKWNANEIQIKYKLNTNEIIHATMYITDHSQCYDVSI